jgi:hypothetical protein
MSVAIEDILTTTCSKRDVELICREVLDNPSKVEIIWLLVNEMKHRSWRAAWVLGYVDDAQPNLVAPYLSRIEEIFLSTSHLGVMRELLKILIAHPFVDEPSGKLLDRCLTIMASGDYPVGLRMCAMEMVSHFCERYPELVDEFIAMLEVIIAEPPSVGTKGRALKLVQRFGGKAK